MVLFLLRPSVVKKFNRDRLKTNVSALIGKDVKVIEEVNNVEEFISLITLILNSNKMKFILKKLQTIFLQQGETTQLLDKPKC